MPGSEHSSETPLMDVLWRELRELKGRVNEMRSIQIENCGRDGRNGRTGELRRDCDQMDQAIKQNQKAIESMLQRQERHGTKLTLLVSLSAALATMVGGAVLRYLGG
jgi:hypothetical protein